MSGPFSDILLGKASIPPSPTRRRILLSFARADGQTWTEDQAESGWTDHMAEQMYGVEADIALAAMEAAWGEGYSWAFGDNWVASDSSKLVRSLDDNPYRAEVSS